MAKKDQKENYERMKDIRSRLSSGKPTTYMERNHLYIYEKRKRKKQQDGEKK